MTPHRSIILYGYCHCGCGQKVSLASRNDLRHGYIAGQPVRYIRGHHILQHRQPICYGVLDGEPVAYIPLTQGYWAIVDRSMLYLVKDGVWFYAHGYACQKRGGKMVMMQNVIKPPLPGIEIDHQFGNRLDNRESQLRYTTHQQNHQNRKLNMDNTSGYKGVSWVMHAAKWMVRIAIDGQRIYVGSFEKDQLIEAAKAYDVAAIKYHGEYARLNFPKKGGL